MVPELRSVVTFTHHNLSADAPPVSAGACVVAFCRNVLIYLTDDEIKRVLDRVATTVGPGVTCSRLLGIAVAPTESFRAAAARRNLRLPSREPHRHAAGLDGPTSSGTSTRVGVRTDAYVARATCRAAGTGSDAER